MHSERLRHNSLTGNIEHVQLVGSCPALGQNRRNSEIWSPFQQNQRVFVQF